MIESPVSTSTALFKSGPYSTNSTAAVHDELAALQLAVPTSAEAVYREVTTALATLRDPNPGPAHPAEKWAQGRALH
jgi:hypothetical protein